MRGTEFVVAVGLIVFSLLTLHTMMNDSVDPTAQFEYEFELLNGKVAVNPYGTQP